MSTQSILAGRLSLLLIFFFCTVITACSTPEEKKERHYLKALEYIKQEKPKAAILELRNAIQIDEKYADARYKLGILYLEGNEPRKAFQELIRAANLDHNNLDANIKAAELYLVSRDKEKSRELVERILEKQPDYHPGLALLANLELIEGKFDKAEEAINKIGEEVNSSPQYLNIKGRVHAEKGEFAMAEEAFKRAIELNSERFASYQILLMLYKRNNEQQKIETLLDEMSEKFPQNPQVNLLLADFFIRKGNREQAVTELNKAIEAADDKARYYLLLAKYYKDFKNFESAIKLLQTAETVYPENTDIKIALATAHFEQKNFDDAQVLLNNILTTNPGNDKAKLLQSRFLLKDNNIQEAIEILEKITNDRSAWSEPFYYLALARFSQGEIELAQYAVNSAIKNKPNESKYHTFLAHLYLLQNSPNQAKKAAAIALKLDPSNFRAAIITTSAFIGEENYDEAKMWLEEMNNRVPSNLEVLGNLAIANLRSGDNESGISILEEILKISPGNNRAVLLLLALKYSDDLSKAEQFIRKQIEDAPENSGLRVLLGDFLLRKDLDEEALAEYEKAIELNPDNIKAYTNSARLLNRFNRTEQAKARFQQMIDQNNNWIQGYMGLAAIEEASDNFGEAMQHYRKVLEIEPNFAPAANNLAWLLAQDSTNDLAEALKMAMLAKKDAPDSPHVSDTLGWVYYQRGSYSLAIAQFKEARAKLPNDPTIGYHLALALNRDGQKTQAMQVLEDLIKNSDDFSNRQEAIALLDSLRNERGE